MARVTKSTSPSSEEVQKKTTGKKSLDVDQRDELTDELHSIYSLDDGELPDFTKLESRQGSRLTRWLVSIILLLLVLSGAAWGGFLLWQRGVFQDAQVLATEIEGSDRVRSGEEIYYDIRYKNDGDVPLAAMEVTLNLPKSFELIDATPSPTEGETFKLGSLSPGSDGTITLKGRFVSEVPSTENIQAFFAYKPANFSSTFEDIQNLSVQIESSVLELELTGPEKALPGDSLEYTINVQNASDLPQEHAFVRLTAPDSFVIDSAEPAPNREDIAEWSLETLGPQALQAITLKGHFTSQASEEQTMRAMIAYKIDEEELLQAHAEHATDVRAGSLALSLIIDGSSANQTAELGETLLVSISYENTSQDALRDFSLELNLGTGGSGRVPIDTEALTEKEDVFSDQGLQGYAFTWDAKNTDAFQQLDPGAKGTIDLTIPLIDPFDPEIFDDVFSLSLKAMSGQTGSIESERIVEAAPITVLLNTDLNTLARARYFTDDGEPVGSGPLPPKVDETTKIQIVWDLKNSLHALNDYSMSTTLPQDVSWTDKPHADIGALTFDSTTRVVTWKIDRLPTSIQSAEAVFEVAITPEKDDVGSFFKLTGPTSVETQDDKTSARLTRGMDALTSELAGDKEADGKGVVVE